jgi:predicted  nucleic acid-binding Zn-ribbon protein
MNKTMRELQDQLNALQTFKQHKEKIEHDLEATRQELAQTKEQLSLEVKKSEQERRQYREEKLLSIKDMKEISIQTDQDLDTV